MRLADLLDRFDSPEESGDGFLAVCPSHSDSHPSLRLALGGNGSLLVKCRAGCDTSEVLEAVGLSFSDLREVSGTDWAPSARSTDEPASPADVAALAVRLDGYADALQGKHPDDPDSLRAAEYADDRFGLDGFRTRDLGLGLAKDLGGGPRLVVPFMDPEGVPRGFQARALDPRAEVRWIGPRSPEGGSWSRLAFFSGGTGWEEVVVTEGPGDGLTACAVGYDTVAVRGAALASREDVARAIAEFAAGRPVVVLGDADTAGRKFGRTLVANLASIGATAVAAEPPEGDLTDWRESAPDTFRESLIALVREAVESAPDRVRARLDGFSNEDLTDLGMAERLRDSIESSGSGVRWTPETGFFILSRGVWSPDSLESVRTRAQGVARSLWQEARELADEIEGMSDEDAKPYRKRVANLIGFARHANSTRGIDSMIRELRALSGVAVEFADFDRHPDRLAVRNGVVDLRTGALLDHDPSLLLTRRVEFAYDPDATAPRWEAFLEEVFPAYPDLPAFIRRMVGYGITGEVAEQCFVVHYGKGANGKSVFTDTLTEVFRALTVTTPFSTFEQKPAGSIPNDLAALKGARLVMASEGESGRHMAEAVLKRVTGRDLISARFMRQEFFEFRPTFLLMLASNYKPAFRGQDDGLWRRVKLVPWERFFASEERDHGLPDRLLAEADGILAWAVRGAVEWYASGLQDPDVIREGVAEYRAASDVLEGFLPGVYEAAEDDTEKIKATEVFQDFQMYAEEHNFRDLKTWSSRALYRALEERGYVRRRGTGGTFFIYGLRRAQHNEGRAGTARLADVPSD